MVLQFELYWGILHQQLERQIEFLSTKQHISDDDFGSFQLLLQRVKILSARESLTEPSSNSTSTSSSSDNNRICLYIDILRCVSLMYAFKVDEDQKKGAIDMIKEMLLNNNNPEAIWKPALTSLIEMLQIKPYKLIHSHLGDMFEFFIDSMKEGPDDNSGAELDDEDREFFQLGITRLLLIVNECVKLSSPSDLLKLFSTSLAQINHKNAHDNHPEEIQSADNDEESIISIIGFINCSAQSNDVSVRVLALEAIALAAQNSPKHFSVSATKVFARASAGGESECEVQKVALLLTWQCVLRGGYLTLSDSLSDVIEGIRSGGINYPTDCVSDALKTLNWADLPSQDRAEILIALVSLYFQGHQFLSISDHALKLMETTTMSTFIESMIEAVCLAGRLIVEDVNFDLEMVLCGITPPCELRDIALFVTSEIMIIAESLGDDHVDVKSAPSLLWSRLCEIVSDDLTRTDQQGYSAVVVQWLLGTQQTQQDEESAE